MTEEALPRKRVVQVTKPKTTPGDDELAGRLDPPTAPAPLPGRAKRTKTHGRREAVMDLDIVNIRLCPVQVQLDGCSAGRYDDEVGRSGHCSEGPASLLKEGLGWNQASA